MEDPAKLDFDEVQNVHRDNPFPFIIVGSGMGGGVLARQLLEHGQRVLLVEKGGLQLPTHCLNMSRAHFDHRSNEGPSRDNELVYQRVKQTYATTPSSDPYGGGPMFCLGGRSLAWSLETPQILEQTLDTFFGPEIKAFLYHKDGYGRALRLLTNSPPGDPNYPDSQAQNTVRKAEEDLKGAIAEYYKKSGKAGTPDVKTARNGAEFANGEKLYYFPQSAYSTVDFLLDRLYGNDKNLTLLLNTEVIDLQLGEGKVDSLTVQTQHGRRQLEARGAAVILCAGTVGTAAIAMRSGMQDKNEFVGKGLTDHEVWDGRSWKRGNRDKDKISNQPVELKSYVKIGKHEALVTVCVNAEKFYSHDFATSSPHRPHPVHVLNILIEFQSKLQGDTAIIVNKREAEPMLDIHRKRLDQSKEFDTDLQILAEQIAIAFGFDWGGPPRMRLTPFGSVAHEVGTMRLFVKPNFQGKRVQGVQDIPLPILGVVDADLKVYNCSNLYVCDLSIFPVSPMANPSLTLAALAIRLGDHLAVKIRFPASSQPPVATTT